MKSPNPIDRIKYDLIDTFNRIGDINTNPTPTMGVDWDDASSVNIATTAAGYLDFSTSGVTDYATHQTNTVGKKISFDMTFGGINKSMFFYLRAEGGDIFSGASGGTEFRIRDDSVNFVYRVRERTSTGSIDDKVLETDIPNASLVGITKFPILIEDTGKELIFKVGDGSPIIIPTTFGIGNDFFQIACALNSGNLISNLRVWNNG